MQYDSCRGLEERATLLLAIDDLYTNRIKHPNVGAVEPNAADPVNVAKRWLPIPLTRAVHLLVVHVRDPHSPVASMQREVASTPPKVAVALDPASNGAVQCSRRPRDQDWGGEEIKNASLKRSDVVDDVFAYEKSSGTCQRLTAF